MTALAVSAPTSPAPAQAQAAAPLTWPEFDRDLDCFVMIVAGWPFYGNTVDACLQNYRDQVRARARSTDRDLWEKHLRAEALAEKDAADTRDDMRYQH